LDWSWWGAQAALAKQLFFVIWRKQRRKSYTSQMVESKRDLG
jgi:hypothetical protein